MTNDRVVIRFAEEEGLLVLDVKDLLRKLARDNKVSRRNMIEVLKDIRGKDNLVIREEQEILSEYK